MTDAEIRTARKRWLQRWWALVVIVVAAASVAGLCIFYTNEQQQEADRRWCELLTSLDQPEQANTSREKEIQQQIHKLRRDMGCEIQ